MAVDYNNNELDDRLSKVDVTIEDPSTIYPENGIVRDKLLNVKAGLQANLEEVPAEDTITSILKNSMPHMLSSGSSNTIRAMKDTLEKEGKDFKKALLDNGAGDVLDFVKSNVKDGGTISKGVDKLKGLLGEKERGPAGPKSARMLSDELFSAINNTEVLKANTEMAAMAATNSSNENNALLLASKHNFNLNRYSTEIAESYYKKSIELKYKTLFSLKDIATTLKLSAAVSARGLQDVTHNTGIPVTGKMGLHDMLAIQLRTRVIGTLYDKTINKYNPIDAFRNSVGRKIGNLKNKVTSALDMTNQGLGMYSMADDMDMGDMGMGFDDDMTEKERREISKEAVLGALAADEGKDFISRVIGGRVQNTEIGKKVFGGLESVLDNPYGFFMNKADNLGTEGIEGMARSAAKATAEMFDVEGMHSGPRQLQDRKSDLGNAALFDNRAHISLTQVIPALLSRISAGVNNGEEVKYDYYKGKFVKASGAKSIIGKDIKSRYIKEDHGAISRTVMRTLDKDKKLTDKEKEDLLLRLSNHKGNIDVRYINEHSKLFEGLDDDVKKKYITAFKGVSETLQKNKSPYYMKRFNSLLTALSENKVDSVDRIQDLINSGFEKDLLKSGVIKKQGIDGQLIINEERYKELNDLGILNAYRDNTKETTLKSEDNTSNETAETINEAIKTASEKISKTKESLKGKFEGYNIVDNIVNETKGFMQGVVDNADMEGATVIINELQKTALAKLEAREILVESTINNLPNGLMRKKAEDMLQHIREAKRNIEKDSQGYFSKVVGSKKKKFSFTGMTDKLKKKIKIGTLEEILIDTKEADTTSRNKLNETITKLTDSLNGKKKKFYDKDGDGDRDNSWKDIVSRKEVMTDTGDIVKIAKKGDKDKKSTPLMSIMKYGVIPILGGLMSGVSNAVGFLTNMEKSLHGIMKFFGTKTLETILKGVLGLGSAVTTGATALFTGAKSLYNKAGGIRGLGKIAMKAFGPLQSAYFGYKAISAAMDGDNELAAVYATGAGASLVPIPGGGIMPGIATELMVEEMGTKEYRDKLKSAKELKEKAKNAEYKADYDAKQLIKARKEEKITNDKLKIGNNIADFISTSKDYNIVTIGTTSRYYDKDGKLAMVTTINTKGDMYRMLYGVYARDAGIASLGIRPKEDIASGRLINSDGSININNLDGDFSNKSKSSTVNGDVKQVMSSDGSINKIKGGKDIKVPKLTNGVSEGDKIILDAIAEFESKKGNAGYTVTVGYNKWDPKGSKPITKLTITQIFDFQKKMYKNGAISTAVGKYQFVKETLVEVVNKGNFDLNAKFSPHMQDKLIIYRLNYKRKYDDWKRGIITDEEFIYNLSGEFASIVNPKTGVGRYDKDGVNKAKNSVANMKNALKLAREKLGMPVSTTSYTEPNVVKDKDLSSGVKTSGGIIGAVESSIKALLSFFNIGKDDTSGSNTQKAIMGPSNRSISSNYDRAAAQKIIENANNSGIPILQDRASKIRYASLGKEAKRFVFEFSKHINSIGIKIQIPYMGGSRTTADQAKLYAQGRTIPGKKVTWTMNSNHIGGRAVDIISAKGYGDNHGNSVIARELKSFANSHPELGASFLSGGKDPHHVQFLRADRLEQIISAEDMVADKKISGTSNAPKISEDSIVKKKQAEVNKEVLTGKTDDSVIKNDGVGPLATPSKPRSIEDMVASKKEDATAEVIMMDTISKTTGTDLAGKLDVEHMVNIQQDKLEEINNKQLNVLNTIAKKLGGVQGNITADDARKIAENKSQTKAPKFKDMNNPDLSDANPITMNR